MSPEIEHHAISPSKLPMLAKCLCYESAPVGEAAEEGSRQHEQLGILLLDKPFENGAEIHPGVAWAAQYIQQRTGNSRLVEERMSLVNDDFEEITFGTLDVVDVVNRSDGDKVVVIDYKSGEDWSYGPQMAAYARMAMLRFGASICEVHELYGRYCKAKSYSLTMAETDYIPDLIAAVQAPDRKPVMCEFCGWCVKHGTCSAAVDPIVKVAAEYEPDGAVAKLPLAEVKTWHASHITDPAQMAVVLQVAEHLDKWAKAVKTHAREAAIGGMEIPGYRLKEGRATREFTDIMLAFSASGLGEDEFMACCSASVPEVELAMAKRAGYKTASGKEAKKRFEELMGSQIHRKIGNPILEKIGA
ncbi:MAG: DUF2800 domain-containing protein [Planctomycetota bacterium]|jgi:hypothetical protein|nr:DUF2800 domain-containing protein [Planctomycetota bacterium]